MEETQAMLRAVLDRLEVMGADIHRLNHEMAEVNGKLTRIESDVAEVKQSQLRLERTMETLALKYIEHDTEIRDLKRIK